ncbi:hypothetical protein [Anoxynatronum sibiricum]|uniref:CARDB domain-containing protein n=1 Tax=Anoxynatronum sibiricum TaxID=210623 RepID=A0ABU9VQ10_9CLOT
MQYGKKWFALIIALLLLLTPLTAWATVGGDGEQPEKIVYYPNITMGTQSRTPTFKAGQDSRLLIPLHNTGQGEARDVVVTLQIDDPAKFPFVMEGLNFRKGVSSIRGRGRTEALFPLTARTNAPAGLYTIPFRVEYANEDLNNRYSFSDVTYVRIENDLQSPTLIIQEVQMTGGRLAAGGSNVVNIHIRNMGDLPLEEIDLTLSGFGTGGIYMDTTYPTRKIDKLAPDEVRSVPFSLRVESGAEEGTYPLQLNMKFKDDYGTVYESKEELYLPVSGSGFTGGLIAIENLQVPANSVQPYTDFPVSLYIRNTSGTRIEEILVKAEGGEALLPKTPAMQQITSLEAGEAKEVTFTFFAKDGIESKNYPLEIRVEPVRSSGNQNAVIQYAGVLVGDTGGSGVPKIIVDRYDYHTDYVQAGDSFPLDLSFLNTHAAQSVRNIRISFTSEGDVFSPVGSSNTMYINRIAPGSRSQQQITLRPKPDASYKVHNLYADIEYEDENGTAHQSKELIGIPVIQEAKLVFGEVETGMEAYVGNPIPISLEFYNGGRGLVRNLLVSIEGDFDTSDGSLYIGNMEAGKSNYYDAQLIPLQPGKLEGKVIFRYDDEINQSHEIEKTFSIEVMEMMAPPDDFWFDEPQDSGGNTSWKWVIVAIAGAAAIAGAVIYRKRKRKKEEVEDDE